jgi:hypothetical protein
MGTEVFLDHLHLLMLGKIFGRFVCQFGVRIVVDVVIEGAIVIVGDLCDGIVENEISFVVDTHDFPLKNASVLGDYSRTFANVLFPKDLLSFSGVHI